MPTTLPPGSVRSAAVVNGEIRALWARTGVLTEMERALYQRLLVEWAAAVRAERIPVAA